MFRQALILGLATMCIVVCASGKDNQYAPINVSAESTSGEKIRGPATIKLTGVNAVRRDVQVGVNVTYPAGPDLTLPFIPPIPTSTPQTTKAPQVTGAAAVKAPPGAAAPPTIASEFSDLVDELNRCEGTRYDQQLKIEEAIGEVNHAKDIVEAFVSSSDGALRTDGSGAALLAQIPSILAKIAPALTAAWPNPDVLLLAGDLAKLKNNMSALPTKAGWDAWSKVPDNRAAYDRAVTRINELIALVAAMDSVTNQSAAAMTTAKKKLYEWSLILESVQKGGSASFERTVRVTCSFTFSSNKESKVLVISTDRLAPAGTAASTQEIVTVICSSPLSISGGFGFSTVDESDIDLIPSTKTTTDTSGNPTTQNISIFGYKGRSSFRPLPLLLLNTRLYEWNDTYSLHFSAGAAVDVKTGSAAGTDVEYVSGLSLGISRTLFVTAAFHAGRVPKLADPFTIKQEVPQGVSKAPIENKWTPGFVVAFTFKLR